MQFAMRFDGVFYWLWLVGEKGGQGLRGREEKRSHMRAREELM